MSGSDVAIENGRKPIWKRRFGRVGLVLLVVLGIVFFLRATVAQVFYVPTEAVAPEIPRDSRVWVNKLSHTFTAGDIVVYRAPDEFKVARVVEQSAETGDVTAARNGQESLIIPARDIVGRVVANTR